MVMITIVIVALASLLASAILTRKGTTAQQQPPSAFLQQTKSKPDAKKQEMEELARQTFEKEFHAWYDPDRWNVESILARASSFECKLKILRSYKQNVGGLYDEPSGFEFESGSCPTLKRQVDMKNLKKKLKKLLLKHQAEKEDANEGTSAQKNITALAAETMSTTTTTAEREDQEDEEARRANRLMKDPKIQSLIEQHERILNDSEAVSVSRRYLEIAREWTANRTSVVVPDADKPFYGIKLAYMIFVHNNPTHVQRLLKAIYTPHFYYVIHVDQKAGEHYLNTLQTFAGKLGNNIQVFSKFRVNWGGFSIIEMTLECIRRLLQMGSDWDYMINLSGADYPLKTQHEITQRLAFNAHRLGTRKLNYLDIKEENMEKEHQGHRMAFVECDNYIFATGYRPVPNGIELFGGSQWFVGHRDFAEYLILNGNLVPKFLQYSKSNVVSDEQFFQTMLANGPFCETIVRTNYRFYKWTDEKSECLFDRVGDVCANHPNDVDNRLLDDLLISQTFFARKFNEKVAPQVVDVLEQRLNQEKRYNPLGTYYIVNQDGFCLTAVDSRSVHVLPCSHSAHNDSIIEQMWDIGPCSNSSDLQMFHSEAIAQTNTPEKTCFIQSSNRTFCSIVSKKFGKCLDIAGGNAYAENPISLFDCHELAHQLWLFGTRRSDLSTGGAQCMIHTRYTYEHTMPPLCIDLNHENNEATLFHCNNFAPQNIQFVRV